MRQFRFRLACFERLLAHREDQAKLRAATAAAGRRRAVDVLTHIQRLVDAARGEHRRRRSEPGFDPREPGPTTPDPKILARANLLVNGDFERGTTSPVGWERVDGLVSFWGNVPDRPGKCSTPPSSVPPRSAA